MSSLKMFPLRTVRCDWFNTRKLS